MNWNENTLNPRVVLGYYDTAPSLNSVEVHRVSLLRDGPTAEIVFDVDNFPERPSPKWPLGANTCQITIRAIGITEVDISRWGTGVLGDLEISSGNGMVEIAFSGQGKFRFLCSHLDVASVSGYIDGRA